MATGRGVATPRPPRPRRRLASASAARGCGVSRGSHDETGEPDVPPVDQYDCIVVDECHRGYLLDRELSDRDFAFRDEADYVSKYRRVLDHFDAVKIGLTATPALHTREIFGAPVFSYSYREAVVDGFLVDHEPPIRIVTRLGADGIHYDAHEEALASEYGGVDDDAVMKITGATDRPRQAIRRFRNERYPNIAVTVDLLTTGIDVPRIANLVFLRRVRSRILYEQMIGRATRLCPEIRKERFRIFDAVDLYSKHRTDTSYRLH